MSESPNQVSVSGTPHFHCHSTMEHLRQDGLKSHDDCLLCLRYGTHCPVGSHPRNDSGKGKYHNLICFIY